MPNSLLIIGFVWPEPNSSAAGTRMMQLITFFLDRNYNITFASTASKTELSEDLALLGINDESIQLNSSSFDDFVQELKPDVIMFDRFMTEEQFGWRIRELCPFSLLILDTEDLHFLRKARQMNVSNNVELDYDTDNAKREIASIYRCDLSLIISEFEMDFLVQSIGVDKSILLYLPFLFSDQNIIIEDSDAEYIDRVHFMTIGNFRHPPNLDAVYYLKNEIWPIIRKALPDTEIHIFGSYCNKKIHSLTDPTNGFLIKGFTKSVEEIFLKYRVCLAPLRYGAGLKGKVFDAFKTGTPCIMTPVAAEGILDEKTKFVAKSASEFAQLAISTYEDQRIWKESQQTGYSILSEKFNKNKFEKDFEDKIDEIKSNLQNHRRKNFIGAMLNYHLLQSHKYMSKWIEEKNRNQ